MLKKNQKAMEYLHFQIILRAEPEGGFTVLAPALPGCVTYGKNLDEARAMAKEAIELYLEDMTAHNEPLPQPHETYVSEVEVGLPVTTVPLHA